MAAGVPLVATRIAGIDQAIRDGRDGVLVSPGDAEELARAIAGVIDGHYAWRRMRAIAFRRHAQHFSDRAMAAGVAAVYRQVLSR